MSHSRSGIRAAATLLLFALSAIAIACGTDPAPSTAREAKAASTPRARSVTISTSSTSDHGAAPASSTDSHASAGTDATTSTDDAHAADTGGDDAHAGPPHWEYTGAAGIVQWADLHESFNTCVDGGAQSPIDVRQAVERDLLNLSLDYSPARVAMVNNGHTIQGNFINGSPGTMTHAGKVYNLLQFHFHRPSEHTVNGYQFAMEVHLVHQASDGSLAVVGVLMEPGDSNDAFDPIWASLPGEEGASVEINSLFDVEKLLPEVQTTYRYPGSLTTPP
ncbi:MAG: carbonic anhydrase family protein, partial [Chloroflexi bacterium]|nr:carbonic anhydrase family protein [Chloroflexota bacterium]